jgi:hypothetical protein
MTPHAVQVARGTLALAEIVVAAAVILVIGAFAIPAFLRAQSRCFRSSVMAKPEL